MPVNSKSVIAPTAALFTTARAVAGDPVARRRPAPWAPAPSAGAPGAVPGGAGLSQTARAGELRRGRIVYISTWTASLPLPFNGPSGASKAALEVIATIHRAELKPFGVEVVVAAPGNMRTGGPAQVAAALKKISDSFSDDQRQLYGKSFGAFANKLNAMQGAGMSAADAAKRVIEIAEENPAPIRAGVGEEAEEILRYVHETPPAEQDIRRLQMVGLDSGGQPL
jgi:NAD(P)-dependent dehydrogenase (short-subunit alcohol dehydrogenase family)